MLRALSLGVEDELSGEGTKNGEATEQGKYEQHPSTHGPSAYGAGYPWRMNNSRMTIAVSGSSGLIGSALRAELARLGHRPVRLVRRSPGTDEIQWDPAKGVIDGPSLEGMDAVVHLAGAGIGDRRWNSAYKQELVDSRVQPTTLLANTLAALDRPPAVFLSASAIGYYGDRGDQALTEDSPAGNGFLPDLVTKWEAAASPAATAGIRTVTMRTGVVYSKKGGALPKLLPLFKFGLGGPMGNGRQYVSWISLDDEVRAIVHLLSADLNGAVNLTAPNPVTNKEQAVALGKALHRPSLLPVPSFGPRLLLGGEMANALLFDSARVLPNRLGTSGFEFTHKTIDEAFAAIV